MFGNQQRSWLERQGILKLLEIKDADIRITTIRQGIDAVDRGIHIGGALSAVIPLVSLYYGGFINADVENPTRLGQDLFVLSKGHAVATMASVYADIGYFDRSILKNSRSRQSILNGHPGPLLPGVHIPTGPMGQGLSVAQGFALVGKRRPGFDVYCLTGDGELQEGTIWEGVMYSAARKLDNLCIIVDKNEGQLDDPSQTVFPMPRVAEQLTAFGWRVFDIDGTQYEPMLEGLNSFKHTPRDGRPTAIISHTRKGFGGFSSFMIRHKVVLPDELAHQEIVLHEQRRRALVSEFCDLLESLENEISGKEIRDLLLRQAAKMNLEFKGKGEISTKAKHLAVKPAPQRDKQIRYNPEELPRLDPAKEYTANSIVTSTMKVFATDPRIASIDADLSTTSGLLEGVSYVDKYRAHNAGVAEANMMCIGEAYAALGFNTWVSTFCPFFNFNVFRRIAIGQQERLEVMVTQKGWLTTGHGLDLTFLATAPNFETKTNGATHMGNDDTLFFKEIAHLKIIDISCPNQLLACMRWIVDGNRGLIYLRIMRAPSGVIYKEPIEFQFGRAYTLKESNRDRGYVLSSGRGVHEALSAAEILESSGISIAVVDLPSIDRQLLLRLYDTGKPVFVAEQNNGYIWSEYRKVLFMEKKEINTERLIPINTLNGEGNPRFIHSATYPELLEQFGLSPAQLAETIRGRL
jgi:transketolase N-terminal domain/subunit/transketolase C-terminal domain/subunit